MFSSEPAAAEQALSLVDVLQQLELPAAESLVNELACYRCISRLRLTCRALRDLADASVRIPKLLTLELRADGTVAQPLACLERWGRRGGIGLLLQLPAKAAAGANALWPAAFAQLPEESRRRVTGIRLSVEEPSSDSDGSDADGNEAARPTISGAAVAALAASLPGLRKLDLSDLPSTWTPGGSGEAYAALAALGTLEELELPGVPGLIGVAALAGSLRSLLLSDLTLPCCPLTLPAAAPLAQLTRLAELELIVRNMDLGEGPMLRNLLRLLPHSLSKLGVFHFWDGPGCGLCGTFGLSGGRLVSADLAGLRPLALAGDELLPCLGPGGRLESLRFHSLYADGWSVTDVAPLLELWRRSNRVRVDELAVEEAGSGADVCSTLAALGPFKQICLKVGGYSISIRLPQQLSLPPVSNGVGAPYLLDLPPPKEVLRMALQRIAPPGAGGQGGAEVGEPSAVAVQPGGRMLLVRGPAAAAALEPPHSKASVAWAVSLEDRVRAVAGAAVSAGTVLIRYALPLPPASAVLLECSDVEGAAEAVAAAVAAEDGSEAARVSTPETRWRSTLEWGLEEVMSGLWAASCAGEGGPNLQQRVEWAMGVLDMAEGLPCRVCL